MRETTHPCVDADLHKTPPHKIPPSKVAATSVYAARYRSPADTVASASLSLLSLDLVSSHYTKCFASWITRCWSSITKDDKAQVQQRVKCGTFQMRFCRGVLS